jgi:hypothetical protein
VTASLPAGAVMLLTTLLKLRALGRETVRT